ncbi:D-alanyl-D-alanine carboxypeptidase precursor [Phycisphaerae bacterium RAS1]|nr:D-alanyl-D-alanine carboxypeptidase precursor [Phycisphaerae bacterium RAS1]
MINAAAPIRTRSASERDRGRRFGLRAAAPAAVFIALIASVSFAQPPAGVAERVNSLVTAMPAGTRVAIVVDDANGQRWIEQQPTAPFKPASVLKLFTTAAALDHFGPQFAFRTRAVLSGRELWIIGGGDPGFCDGRIAERHGRPQFAALDEWAAALRERGVTQIDKLVLDDTIFDQQFRHADWPEDQADRWYQAPVGGLNINDNCLDVRVRVEKKAVAALLTPELPGAFVRNLLKAGKSHNPSARREPDSDIFELKGVVGKNDDLGPVSAGRPSVFFGHVVKAELEKRGIRCGRDVVRRTISADEAAAATPIGSAETPLTDVIWRANTFSQNLFAECLAKSLAAYDRVGRPTGAAGSWETGMEAIRRTLGSLGVDLSGATLRDGSGLSHSNAVSAAQIVSLLRAMDHHRHRDAWRASLAVAGRDGTMRRRLSNPPLAERLVGKTGSIQGVTTLAGYLRREDGVELAFAILVNEGEERGLCENVCKALLE